MPYRPALFPAFHPAFPPEAQCYRGLYISNGGPWQPVHGRGHIVYRAIWPQHLYEYDARNEFPELNSSSWNARPHHFAGLWVLTEAGIWQLAKYWTDYGNCREGCVIQ